MLKPMTKNEKFILKQQMKEAGFNPLEINSIIKLMKQQREKVLNEIINQNKN